MKETQNKKKNILFVTILKMSNSLHVYIKLADDGINGNN